MAKLFFTLLICWAALSSTASAETTKSQYPLMQGDTRYEMPIENGVPLPLWTHKPDGIALDAPVLIVMHGNSRDADRYLHQWRDLSDQYGFYLIVPEFSRANYRGSRQYHLGHVVDPKGKVRPKSEWSFSYIEQAFDFYRAQYNITTTDYSIYGHSAGSQFVHRFLYHLPESRAKQFVAANAGWYTMPDAAQEWPYGLGSSLVTEAMLKHALGRPVLVLLGDQDIDPENTSLRKTSEAMLQGPHRFARGHHFFAAAQTRAAVLDTPFTWKMAVVPDVAHDNRGMALAAARYLFGD